MTHSNRSALLGIIDELTTSVHFAEATRMAADGLMADAERAALAILTGHVVERLRECLEALNVLHQETAS